MGVTLEVLPGGVVDGEVGQLVVHDDDYELAIAAVDALADPGELVCCDDIVYRYNRSTGVWGAVSHDELVTRISALMRNVSVIGGNGKPKRLAVGWRRMNDVAKFINHIEDIHNDHYFADAWPGIAFKNYFVFIGPEMGNTPTPVMHSWENKAKSALSIDYQPDAVCPKWDKFLADVFAGAADAAARNNLLAEFIGAAMAGKSTRYAKCLWLTGPGNNGKSTLAAVVEHLFARGAVSSVPPKDWADEKKYYLHRLIGSALNIVTEMVDTKFTGTDIYKSVVSGDAIEARPIRGSPVRFRPSAGHILACNALPMTSDQSLGFWRRAQVLLMDRDFSGLEVDQGELIDSLLTELPGIAVWALRGYERLVKAGKYTNPPSSIEAKADWRDESSEIIGWMRSCCTEIAKPDDLTRADILYESFVTWCRTNGYQRPMHINQFSRQLTGMRIDKRKTNRGRCYNLMLASNISGGGINPGWAIGDN